MSTRTNKDEKTIWLQPWAKFIRKERMIRRVKPKVQRKELKAMENYFQALDPNQETANLCISSPVFTWKTVFESLYLSLICKCTCLTWWNYVLSADTVYGTLPLGALGRSKCTLHYEWYIIGGQKVECGSQPPGRAIMFSNSEEPDLRIVPCHAESRLLWWWINYEKMFLQTY